MRRVAFVLSAASAFAPAPRLRLTPHAPTLSRPVSGVVGSKVPPVAAVALPGAEWNGCVAVQGAWFATYYAYMWLSASVPADGSEAQNTWATRCFLNMGEQAPAFLAAFWSHAVFACPRRAAACGGVYVATRVLYGIQRFWLKGGMSASAGFGSTVPGYVINTYLMATVVARRCFGKVGFGASPWSVLAFFPVVVTCFLLAGKANEAVKANFADAATA